MLFSSAYDEIWDNFESEPDSQQPGLLSLSEFILLSGGRSIPRRTCGNIITPIKYTFVIKQKI